LLFFSMASRTCRIVELSWGVGMEGQASRLGRGRTGTDMGPAILCTATFSNPDSMGKSAGIY
jgi:hypothetical protein